MIRIGSSLAARMGPGDYSPPDPEYVPDTACEHCGDVFEYADADEDGEVLPAPRFCPECQRRIDDGDSCRDCGHPIDWQPSRWNPDTPPSQCAECAHLARGRRDVAAEDAADARRKGEVA